MSLELGTRKKTPLVDTPLPAGYLEESGIPFRDHCGPTFI